MGRFGRVLRRVERRLEAPEPERSRILLEMASDLEELYRAYRDRGLGEEEARRKAEKWLAPSAGAIDSLRTVHLPGFDRLLDRLAGTRRGRVELVLAALVALAAAGGGALAALRSGALSPASPGLWVVAGLAAVGLGSGLRQGYALFVRGDRLGPGWRRRLRRIPAAAVAAALAGATAAGLRLTLVGGGAADAEGLPAGFWSELSTAAGVAALALGAASLLAVVWLLLRTRAATVTRARAELREAVGSFEETAELQREEAR